jgi:hypothetical protein
MNISDLDKVGVSFDRVPPPIFTRFGIEESLKSEYITKSSRGRCFIHALSI